MDYTDGPEDSDDSEEGKDLVDEDQNQLYVQLALYCCGNALALVLGLIIWEVWNLLADFRDAMLWALLCSIALRDLKNHLVQLWRERLNQER